MKVQPSVKRLCNGCYTHRINGKLRVGCKKNAKHKQRQGN